MPETQNTEQTSALVVTPNVSGAVVAMQQFQLLKSKLLDANDIVSIQSKPFIKRSGWRKIALAFNVTTEIIRTYPIKDASSAIIGYTVESKATAANGRYAIDQASCEFSELEVAKTHHNCITKATTRAINRCVSDLVGGGEVSAEEMVGETMIEVPHIEQHDERAMSEGQKKYIAVLTKDNPKASAFMALYIERYFHKKPEELSMTEAKELIDRLKNRQYDEAIE